MTQLHPEPVGRLLEWMGPPADGVLAEMETRAEREGFPTVGPEVGRTLALCTRLTGARSVLELGSGFGYSAYWIARALPADGEVVLTERDGGLVEDARAYFERGDLADRAVFEHGDAVEIASGYGRSFDLVVLDHDTAAYVEGFEAVCDSIEPGGVVVADNVVATDGGLTPEDLLTTLDGAPAPTSRARDAAAYYEYVRDLPAFETYLLPVGEGVAISCRLSEEDGP